MKSTYYALLLLIMLAATAPSHSIQALAENDFSHADGKPWLILIKQSDCRYCEILKAKILDPLRASELYSAMINIAEVSIDPGQSVIDFNGEAVAAVDFASRFGGFATPTLLWLSTQAEVIHPPMFGLPATLDFYTAEIEALIQTLAVDHSAD